MAHLLHIDSSIQGDRSISRALTARAAARWHAAHPGSSVTYRDLAVDPIPHFGPAGNEARSVPADQWNEAPGRVLTSMTKELEVGIYATVKRVRDGNWQGGVLQFGLREKGVDYVYDAHNRALIGDAVHARVEQLRADIIAGKIQVPDR